MYTAEAEREYKRAAELLRCDDFEASYALTRELEESMPESAGVAMLEALNLYMLGRTDEAMAACERVRGRIDAVRHNSESLGDLLNDAQRLDLDRHLDEHETKVRALIESMGRPSEDRPKPSPDRLQTSAARPADASAVRRHREGQRDG
jgi:hypothetical protein